MRVGLSVAAACMALGGVSAAGADAGPRQDGSDRIQRALSRSYQGRPGPERTERFSRKVKLGSDGRVTITNVSGEIVVATGSGEEVSIEAVKRAWGGQDQLSRIHIEVDERKGRLDIRTAYEDRSNSSSVDYTITVPQSTSVELRSVSGDLRVTGVGGIVRAETVSGNVMATDVPRLEMARSVSGNVDSANTGADADLSASSISGSIRAKGLNVRSLDAKTVSGDLVLTDAVCERLFLRSISGRVEFSGSLARNGRYDISTHSGSVRVALPASTGFDLSATTFSGAIRSDFPAAAGDDGSRNRGRRGWGPGQSIHTTVGDGSATVTVRTFSGGILITRP